MNKKTLLIISVVIVLMAAAAAGIGLSFYLSQQNIKNNVTDNIQNSSRRNRDGNAQINSDSGNMAQETIETKNSESQPLYLTTMTHLENDWNIDTNEAFFNQTVESMRYGMDLAEQYNAILTFESGLSFAEGINNFGDNVMKEALDRGFGVGTHVDLSAKTEMTSQEAVQIVKEHVDAVSALVRAENNVACSGVSAKSDWYGAAKGGGCKAIDGVVGFAYLAMPLENRPAGWTDTAILKEKFHYPAPVGDDRFYPFWINSSEDFIEDADGDVLLSSGETFSLAMFAEAGGRNGDRPTCANDCPLTMDDVTAAVNDIKDFAASRDTFKIAKYNFYFPSNLFVPENEEILNKFFSEMQTLQDQGVLKWASQKGIYEAKIAEKNNL